MTKRDGPKTQIKRALAAANREISGNARRGGPFAGGLAGEGWAGGYASALSDVLLVLNGVQPSTRGYWERREDGR